MSKVLERIVLNFRMYCTLTVFCLLLAAALAVYRVTLHPLASFPGPKLAAATGWYETYYDCFLLGKFSNRIDRLHEGYGPVVRINPWEIHIKDPEFFDKIYAMAPKLDKDPWYFNFAGISNSTFATSDTQLHRHRRAAISKIFSTSYAMRVQPVIEKYVGKLMSIIQDGLEQNPEQPFQMSQLYWCMASDVVTCCMMPCSIENLCARQSAPDFGKVFKKLARIVLLHRHFGCLFIAFMKIPHCVVKLAAPAFREVINLQDDLSAQVSEVASSSSAGLVDLTRSTLPSEILRSSLPPHEKRLCRITEDVTMIVGAGTEATGAALSITTFYLLADSAKCQRLKQELASLEIPRSSALLSYQQLARCTYLTACISEGLRLSKESNRMPRINRSTPTYYREWTIPAGTPISMSLRDVHLDPLIFPNPRQFQPERWLAGNKKEGLERFLVPFGKGTRGCLGMHLALAELYLTIGNLFHRFDMELYETDEDDIRLAHDFFSLDGSKETIGLQLLVRKSRATER